MRYRTIATALLPVLVPGVASAQTLSVVSGVFNILVGLMLTVAFLMFGGALVAWYVRRGAWPGYRDETIHYMQWSVTIMFVLVVLLGIVHFIQVHQAAAAFVFGVILFFLAVWFIMTAVTAKSENDSDDH